MNVLLKYSCYGNISNKHNIDFTSVLSFINKYFKKQSISCRKKKNLVLNQEHSNMFFSTRNKMKKIKKKPTFIDISQRQGDRSFPFWVKSRWVFFTAICSKHLLTLSLDITCCSSPVKKIIKSRRSVVFQTMDSVQILNKD